MANTRSKLPPVAVVGVSALFPGSLDNKGFWKDILAGKDLVGDVPESHWLIDDYYDPDPKAPDKTYCKRGAFIDPISFDCLGFGTPPNLVQATDSSQLLALIVAQKVLEDAAQGSFEHIDRSRMSCILGATGATELVVHLGSRLQRPIWLKALRDSGVPEGEAQDICQKIADSYVPWTEASFPGLLGNVVAGRIANRFDLGGTNCVVDAACASSLSAVAMGLHELYLGQSDFCITGGVDTLNDILMYMCFSKTPALSPTGDCRPFSDQADGTIMGEGLGMVALRRLEDAERDGDRIYAVIQGLGSSSDGRSKSVYAPRPAGQAKALERAYENAGYGPETVELVEAHGTGTKAGDAAEFESLNMAFSGSKESDRPWVALGSIKSQIGHTKGAAGAASLFKGVMALHHKVFPPTIKVERPNPKMDLNNSPFYISTKARPWIRGDDHPRRASISSFGFGGTNFHIALEEYNQGKKSSLLYSQGTELVTVSGASPEDLRTKCKALIDGFNDDHQDALAFIARQSHGEFQSTDPARLAFIATDLADLKTKIARIDDHLAKNGSESSHSPAGWSYSINESAGKVAFLFPGQGSQYLDMGADLAMRFDSVRNVWDQSANKALEGDLKLHEVVYPSPNFDQDINKGYKTRLTETQWAQPAIGITSASMLALLTEMGLSADCLGGHSFGEVTALHAGGRFSAEDFLKVARKRGELMAEAAAQPGSMTAVSSDSKSVQALLDEMKSPVIIANHNSPKQIVLSGKTEDIEAAEAQLKANKFRFKRLPVATAFHSSVVSSASGPFHEYLKGLSLGKAQKTIYANSTAQAYPDSDEQVAEILAGQVAKPVLFADQIRAMADSGVKTFIEVGPGNILSNLVNDILADREDIVTVNLDRKGKNGLTSLHHALARILTRGLETKLAPLSDGLKEIPDPRTVKKARLSIELSGVNHDKPYPPKGGSKALPAPNPPRPKVTSQPKITTQPKATSTMTDTNPAPAPAPTPAPVPHTAPAPHAAAAPMTPAPMAQPAPLAYQVGSSEALQWVQAFQTLQQHTVNAHMKFLDVAGQSLSGLSALLTGAPIPTQQQSPTVHLPAPAPYVPAPAPVAAPAPAVYQAAPVPAPAPVAPVAGPVAAAPVAAPTPAPVAAPAPTPVAAPAPAPSASAAVDIHALMLSVVAEKTGYPEDMLEPQMELESDLGIDSIKRVEILSTMQEKVPNLPEVDPSEMASLRTLGSIVDFMNKQLGVTDAPAPEAAPSAAPAAPSAAPAASSGALSLEALNALMLTVVSEKTGYPEDMLESEMELESDLGIDSIKRVEILSAMQEKVPNLPEVDPAEMASLRTLGSIVEFMAQQSSGGSAQSADEKKKSSASRVRRYTLETVNSPASSFAPANLFLGQTLWVTDEGRGIGAELVSVLNNKGLKAELTKDLPRDAECVIVLEGLSHSQSIEDALNVNRKCFEFTCAVAPQFEQQGGFFFMAQDTGGQFGGPLISETGAWSGGLSGLVKTAAQEWPSATVRVVDIHCADRNPSEIAAALAAEILSGGVDREIALSAKGERTKIHCSPVDASGGQPAVNSDSVIIVSGGGRGVTAAATKALARDSKASFALLGRTALQEEPACCHGIDEAGLKKALLMDSRSKGEKISPAELGKRASRITSQREIRQTLSELERAGSKAAYFSCDVTNVDSVTGVFEDVRNRFGAITGIVHGAGVLADKMLSQKTMDQFDRVFNTKVRGLRTLLEASANDPLTMMVYFSSVAARSGNIGQSDYALSNEILNRVADYESKTRGAQCKVKSMAWGPWESGMVSPALKARFEQMGVPLIPLKEGADLFVKEVQQGRHEVVNVVIGGPPLDQPLAHPAAQVSKKMTALVGAEIQPHLKSHQISDVAVLPLVLVEEWFARAARAVHSDYNVVKVEKLQVVRGIQLHQYHDGFEHFDVEIEPLDSNGQCTARLIDPDKKIRFTGKISLKTEYSSAPKAPVLSGLEAVSLSGTALYQDRLFHGPDFAAIKEIDGLGTDGASALLQGTLSFPWPGEDWVTDPALIDGGLQLARIWGYEKLDSPTLPTSLESLVLYRSGLIEGPVRCLLRGQTMGKAGTRSDLWFIDQNGQVIAEIQGLKMHVALNETSGARS